MPVFEYKGVNAKGKALKDFIDAPNISEARTRLRRENIFVTEIVESLKAQAASSSQKISFSSGVSVQDLSLMTQQLGTLLSSGVRLVDSLSALVDQVESIKLKQALSDIRGRVNEGSSLADAMRQHPKIFNNLYTNMIRAGEASGALEAVLDRLSTFTENQNKLKGKIVSAMAYPIFMIIMGIASVIIIMTVVMPKLIDLYSGLNQALPLPTRILIWCSNFMTSYWYILLALAGIAGWMIVKYLRTDKGAYWLDNKLLNLPLFGPLFRMVAVARFANTLSTLLASGVKILPAMDIVKKVVDNRVLAEVIENARENVSEGATIAEPLKKSKQFPPLVTHMIAVGEKSGELEAMLEKVAQTYNQQVETKVETLTSLIEPLMILLMVGVIGSIIMSVMLPIFQMSNAL
ncbi:MAG: type II secretion system inner membrane protein GspF [Bdellovibrionota bacterium]